jgi:two-component system, NarL family, nitrate/nitrite response regulator NarL
MSGIVLALASVPTGMDATPLRLAHPLALTVERDLPAMSSPEFECNCRPKYPIRIVAAEQQPIVREGLHHMLASQHGFIVVGGAGSGADTVRIVSELAPDALLLDLAIRDGTALEVLQALHDADSPTRAVLLADVAGNDDVLEAVRLGARGIVLKTATPRLLYKCVRCVVAGEYWFGNDQLPTLIDALRQSPPHPAPPAQTLTRREIQVIAAIVDGATNRAIAEQLGMSDQTVKNHLSHIYDKVGVSNRLELALYAIHHKLTDRHR